MVEYIVRNTEMLKNTIVVHRGHFGGSLLIHQGAAGRNIWGTGTAGSLGCSLRTSGWNGRSSSPDATSSSQPSRRHGPLARPLAVPSHYHTLSQPWGWAQGLCHEDFPCAVNAAWTTPATYHQALQQWWEDRQVLGPMWDKRTVPTRMGLWVRTSWGKEKLLVERTPGYNDTRAEISPVRLVPEAHSLTTYYAPGTQG